MNNTQFLKTINEKESQKLVAIFLLTDGSVGWNKFKKCFLIRFLNKDLSLHNFFKAVSFMAFKENPTFEKVKDGKILVTGFSRIANRKIPKILFSLSPSFKTKPGKIPSSQFLKLPQPTISFLIDSTTTIRKIAFRIAMACDGSIGISFDRNGNPKPRLRLACAHPILVEEWKKLANSISLKMNIERDINTWSGIHGLITNKISDLLHFRDIGGFLPKDTLVCRGRFKGKTKNYVLNLAINMKS